MPIKKSRFCLDKINSIPKVKIMSQDPNPKKNIRLRMRQLLKNIKLNHNHSLSHRSRSSKCNRNPRLNRNPRPNNVLPKLCRGLTTRFYSKKKKKNVRNGAIPIKYNLKMNKDQRNRLLESQAKSQSPRQTIMCNLQSKRNLR